MVFARLSESRAIPFRREAAVRCINANSARKRAPCENAGFEPDLIAPAMVLR